MIQETQGSGEKARNWNLSQLREKMAVRLRKVMGEPEKGASPEARVALIQDLDPELGIAISEKPIVVGYRFDKKTGQRILGTSQNVTPSQDFHPLFSIAKNRSTSPNVDSDWKFTITGLTTDENNLVGFTHMSPMELKKGTRAVMDINGSIDFSNREFDQKSVLHFISTPDKQSVKLSQDFEDAYADVESSRVLASYPAGSRVRIGRNPSMDPAPGDTPSERLLLPTAKYMSEDHLICYTTPDKITVMPTGAKNDTYIREERNGVEQVLPRDGEASLMHGGTIRIPGSTKQEDIRLTVRKQGNNWEFSILEKSA